jgi:pimeloyl-ACP methyl ester carboxylesterase
MIHYLETKISKLRFSDQGEGEVLILLHGYLEAIESFDAFTEDLATNVRVICIDLPGHGQSTIKPKNIGIEDMAEVVLDLILELKLGKVHLLGHSMGAYVALAFADKYPDYLASLSLLHSTANPDTREKKENRKREIGFIKRGKKELICNTAIPNTFSRKNQERFCKEIEDMVRIASKTSEDGIIVALNAMMNRPDRNEVLRTLRVPKYSFVGKEDNFIPFEKGIEWADANGMNLIVFEHSGHMSFIEEKEKCVEAVIKIVKSV